MKNAEKAVRSAAKDLHDAIDAARKEGLAIAWPHRADGLLSIAISETGKAPVAKAETAAPKPAAKPNAASS